MSKYYQGYLRVTNPIYFSFIGCPCCYMGYEYILKTIVTVLLEYFAILLHVATCRQGYSYQCWNWLT